MTLSHSHEKTSSLETGAQSAPLPRLATPAQFSTLVDKRASAPPAAPGETARDHIANALQIVAGHPAGYDLGGDTAQAVIRRLRLALADLDARGPLAPVTPARGLAPYGYAVCCGAILPLGAPCAWCGQVTA